MSKGKFLFLISVFFISVILLSNCDSRQTVGVQESLNVIPELTAIEGGESSTIKVNRGSDSYFTIDVSNIGSNQFISEGAGRGWCIAWNQPIRSDGTEYDGIKLYSTHSSDHWRPINYFLSIRDELKIDDPSLTFKEFQVVIWSLLDFPEFNLNKINIEALPSQFVENGQYAFNQMKVEEIISRVRENYGSFQYSSYTASAVIAETDSDTQTVIIEPDSKRITKIIGIEGGSFESPDNLFELVIPENAVNSDTEFFIEIDTDAAEMAEFDSENYLVLSNWYKLGPSELTFDEPLTIKFQLDEDAISQVELLEDIEILYFTDDYNIQGEIKWKKIDETENVISAEIDHFTSFSLMYPINKLIYNFKWDVDTIYYYVGEDTPGYLWSNDSFGSESDRNELIENAVELWEQYQGRFRIERTHNEDHANIILNSKESVLGGHARANIHFFRMYGFKTTFNENIRISIDFESSHKLFNGYYSYDAKSALSKLITHEVGHVLGLAHNPKLNSTREPDGVPMMWVAGLFGDPFNELDREITGDDIATLQSLYGEPEVTTDWPRDTTTEIVDVYNPATGQTWMDRNLGASRAATSMDDEQAYGDLYQWGRAADGHQKRNSPTTSTLSNTDQPGHGSFILATDWRSPQNDNLWQGGNGINNPCPDGYRLPTEAEWNAERQSWSSNNAAGAYASPLKLPVAGRRSRGSGSLNNVGLNGYYWSGTADGTYARLSFFSGNAGMLSPYRAGGFSVRCLKN